jgi:hypothetical protein
MNELKHDLCIRQGFLKYYWGVLVRQHKGLFSHASKQYAVEESNKLSLHIISEYVCSGWVTLRFDCNCIW